MNPAVIPAQADYFDRCRDFAKSYIFPDQTYRKVWLLFAHGTPSRAIAVLVGLCRHSVRWRIKHGVSAMKERERLHATMPPHIQPDGADILEVFVQSATVTRHVNAKERAVRTWREEHAAPAPVTHRSSK